MSAVHPGFDSAAMSLFAAAAGAALALAGCAVGSAVDRTAPADLAGELLPIREEFGVPALAAAVVEQGRITAIGALGVRRAGWSQPVTTEDCWQLGSCTKAMTASVLASLIEHGLFSWDATLGSVFPEYSSAMHADYRGASVRQLVDHRAGLPANTTSGSLLEQLAPSRDPVRTQRIAAVRELLAQAPPTPVGEYVYSNSGYLIAGAIIERLTDGTWEAAMQDELFGPLGMHSAGFGPPGAGVNATQPWGHRAGPRGLVAIDPDSALARQSASYGPAGSVHLSLGDWAKFAAMHLGASPQARTILSPAALEDLHRPGAGADYASGFAIVERDWASGPVLAHEGMSAAWYALMWLSPRDGFALLVACNQGGDIGQRACRAAATALAVRHVSKPPTRKAADPR